MLSKKLFGEEPFDLQNYQTILLAERENKIRKFKGKRLMDVEMIKGYESVEYEDGSIYMG